MRICAAPIHHPCPSSGPSEISLRAGVFRFSLRGSDSGGVFGTVPLGASIGLFGAYFLLTARMHRVRAGYAIGAKYSARLTESWLNRAINLPPSLLPLRHLPFPRPATKSSLPNLQRSTTFSS